jgi:methyl-accepting chemotaxis protein
MVDKTALLTRIKIGSRLWLLIGVAVLSIGYLTAVFLLDLKSRMLEERKIATRQLVETAVSVLDKYHALTTVSGGLNETAAQQNALDVIKSLRYDRDNYFWINDKLPKMVMHPIKPELDGKDLRDSKDPANKHLFVEMVEVVKRDGAGFVPYMWPKPGAANPVPKISYVKEFKPWGWIVGSGIYVDDVDQIFQQAALYLSGLILFAIVVLIVIGKWITVSITQPLRNAATMVNQIADGDLSADIVVNGRDETAQMLSALREMVGKLKEITSKATHSSDQVAAIASEVAQGSSDLAQRTEQQASALEETASSMEELTSTVKNSADSDHYNESAIVKSQDGFVECVSGAGAGDRINWLGYFAGASSRSATNRGYSPIDASSEGSGT